MENVFEDQFPRLVKKQENIREQMGRVSGKKRSQLYDQLCDIGAHMLDQYTPKDRGEISIYLEEIKGIGEETAARIQEKFDTNEDFEQAVEDSSILEVKGVGEETQERIRIEMEVDGLI